MIKKRKHCILSHKRRMKFAQQKGGKESSPK